jgi:AbrB family looped-hinge helix DNA binding protein
MTLTRMRGKGQLTLPEEIRRAARLQEGDYLEVSIRGGEIVGMARRGERRPPRDRVE